MHKSFERKVRFLRPSSSLGPPPLFRSIGPPGLSPSLPPHRRLRSMFSRSTAVLPASIHATGASDTHTFTDIHAGSHAHTLMSPLDGTEVDSEPHRRAVLRAESQCGRQHRQMFAHLCPSAPPNGRNRGRQGRLVTPLQTSSDPVIKDKQQQKRRKRGYKVDCVGKQKYVLPSLSEKEEDARLCEWFRSLGLADSQENNSVTKNNPQRLFVSRCTGTTGLREQDAAASHRRDRRPHFLPPICQSDSLLHVPLLFPENSPPPSPCSHPDVPVQSLPVPLLQPFSSWRK